MYEPVSFVRLLYGYVMIGIIQWEVKLCTGRLDEKQPEKPVKIKTLLILYFLPRCGRETTVKIPEYLTSTMYEVE